MLTKRRLLLGPALLCAAALLLTASGGWAKSHPVADISGPISVDLSARTVIVAGVSLEVAEPSSISLNSRYATLEELGAFLARNPPMDAEAEYLVMPDKYVLWSLDVGTTVMWVGIPQIDAAHGTLMLDGLTVTVTTQAWIDINGYNVSLAGFAGFLERNPDARVWLNYYMDAGTYVLASLHANTENTKYAPIRLDLIQGLVFAGDDAFTVTSQTESMVEHRSVDLPALAGYLSRNPGVNGSVLYSPSTDTPLAEVIAIEAPGGAAQGSLQVDLAHGQVVVAGDIRVTVTPDTEYWCEWSNINSLRGLASYVKEHPDAFAVVDYYIDGDKQYAIDIEVWPDGGSGDDEDWDDGEGNSDNGDDGNDVDEGDWFAAASTHRRPIITQLGRLKGASRNSQTLTFRPRLERRNVQLWVPASAVLSVNGAHVPFELFCRMQRRSAIYHLEAAYQADSHFARKIVCERRLRYGEGKVLATRRNKDGVLVTISYRSGKKTRKAQVQVLNGSVVMQKQKLVRPTRIRAGDFFAFDGFIAGGRVWAPRVLVRPAAKGRG